jgi:predicted nucleotidyltransferase component of viral defense system
VIPRDFITEWRQRAPWVQDLQVEQDLVISRALVAIFSDPLLRNALAFRGGTALYKLHMPPARYSEDIDLVQMRAEPAGPMLEALHQVLDLWLGKPALTQNQARVTLLYRFTAEGEPPTPLKLKVETNSREHFAVHGFKEMPFAVDSRWFTGECRIATYELDELLGTKLRALYQRRKSRDLFDLAIALRDPNVDPSRVVATYATYMEHGGHKVSRAEFEQSFDGKMKSSAFRADISALLAPNYSWDIDEAAAIVSEKLISRLPGAPWKGRG